MLSYYIGYYLLPAVVGKITGSFRAAELMEFILSMAGLWMVWVLLCYVVSWDLLGASGMEAGRGRKCIYIG